MKKTILSIIIVVIVLCCVAGTLVLADKLFYRAEDDVVSGSDIAPLSGIGKIEVSLSVGFVNISEKPSGENITLDYVGLSTDFYSYELAGDTLRISDGGMKWYDQLRYSTADKYGVTVGIPADFDGEIVISADAGSVTVKDVDAKAVDIEADTGDISVSYVTVDDLHITADVGEITIDSVNIMSLSAEADVGSINVSRINAKDAETGAKIELMADVGEITGSFPLKRDAYTVEANSDLGTAPEGGGDGNIHLILSSDVGSITVSFGEK